MSPEPSELVPLVPPVRRMVMTTLVPPLNDLIVCRGEFKRAHAADGAAVDPRQMRVRLAVVLGEPAADDDFLVGHVRRDNRRWCPPEWRWRPQNCSAPVPKLMVGSTVPSEFKRVMRLRVTPLHRVNSPPSTIRLSDCSAMLNTASFAPKPGWNVASTEPSGVQPGDVVQCHAVDTGEHNRR